MKQVYLLTIAISVFPISAYSDNPPYLGMSKSQFDMCKNLGKQVIDAQRVKPDSLNHKKAYKIWDDNCGMKIMLPLAIKYKINMKNIPSSPLDWMNQ